MTQLEMITSTLSSAMPMLYTVRMLILRQIGTNFEVLNITLDEACVGFFQLKGFLVIRAMLICSLKLRVRHVDANDKAFVTDERRAHKHINPASAPCHFSNVMNLIGRNTEIEHRSAVERVRDGRAAAVRGG